MKKKKDTLFNDYFDEWFESEKIKNAKLNAENKQTDNEIKIKFK